MDRLLQGRGHRLVRFEELRPERSVVDGVVAGEVGGQRLGVDLPTGSVCAERRARKPADLEDEDSAGPDGGQGGLVGLDEGVAASAALPGRVGLAGREEEVPRRLARLDRKLSVSSAPLLD